MFQAINPQPITDAEVRAHFGQGMLAGVAPTQAAEILNDKIARYGQLRLVSITSSQPKRCQGSFTAR